MGLAPHRPGKPTCSSYYFNYRSTKGRSQGKRKTIIKGAVTKITRTRKERRRCFLAGGPRGAAYYMSILLFVSPRHSWRSPGEGPHHPTTPLHLPYITGLPGDCRQPMEGALIAPVGLSRSETWPAHSNYRPLAIIGLGRARGPRPNLPPKGGLGGFLMRRRISRGRRPRRRTGSSRASP